MAAVSSTMQALNSKAPDFSLLDVIAGDQFNSLDNYIDKPLMIMFICNHCPFVVHIIAELTELANRAQRDGFAVVAISSNDAVVYPQDGPEAMADFAIKYGFEFPYLYDETQQVAKLYGAACTPDFFVYDADHRLCYRGQMDDSRPGNGRAVTGNQLSSALAAVSNGDVVDADQVPSVGCSIKWRNGNEPDYV